MKKNLLTFALCSFAFGLGFGMNNIAFSNITPAKVAYVNVPKLLSASKTLKAAQDTQLKQTKDMLKWYDTASADIQKQKIKAGKDDLIKKYEAQLTQKKKTIKAKAMGYELVLRKDAVLFGGTDITAEILPLVK